MSADSMKSDNAFVATVISARRPCLNAMPAYPTSQRVTVPLLGWEPRAGHRIGSRRCPDYGHATDELADGSGHHQPLRPGRGHVSKRPTGNIRICTTLGSSIL